MPTLASAPTLIYFANVSGTGTDVQGVLGTLNDSLSFQVRSGKPLFYLQCTRTNFTNFIAKPWVLADDGTTWLELLDSAKASISVFGTISASTSKAYPLYLTGAGVPAGALMRLTLVLTGTPGGSDSVRIGMSEAA